MRDGIVADSDCTIMRVYTDNRRRVMQEGGIFGAVTTTDAILEKIGIE